MSGLLPDYGNQARTYDETRVASPSVLGPLREALDGAPGPRLLDVGGGTGNYAAVLRDEGWEPVVCDRSPDMLARAAGRAWRSSRPTRRYCRSRRVLRRLDVRLHAAPRRRSGPRARRAAARPSPRRSRRTDGLRARGHRGRLVPRLLPVHPRLDGCVASARSTDLMAARPRRPPHRGGLPRPRRLPRRALGIPARSWTRLAPPDELLRTPRARPPRRVAAGLERLRADIASGNPPPGRGRATVLAWTG